MNAIAISNNDMVYIADFNNNCIRLISPAGTGLNDLNSSNSISIYPNPATNQVTIDYCPYPSSENHLVIYNINGVELLNQHFKKGETLIDISAFPAGIYFMKLVVDNITALKKIIKQ